MEVPCHALYAERILEENEINSRCSHIRIMDADMAYESTKMASHNVLLQAAASMVTQANSLNSVVLFAAVTQGKLTCFKLARGMSEIKHRFKMAEGHRTGTFPCPSDRYRHLVIQVAGTFPPLLGFQALRLEKKSSS